jgi:hypothetical protein
MLRKHIAMAGLLSVLPILAGCTQKQEPVPPPATDISAQKGSPPAQPAEMQGSMGKKP